VFCLFCFTTIKETEKCKSVEIQSSENNEPSKKVIKKRVSKGIPQTLRGKIWPLISKSKSLAEKLIKI
jgi:hypothetical protein